MQSSNNTLIATCYFSVQLKDIGACTLLVELDLRRPYPSRGSDLSTWEVDDPTSITYMILLVLFSRSDNSLQTAGIGRSTVPGQRAFPCIIPVLLHTIPMATKQRVRPVQATEEVAS